MKLLLIHKGYFVVKNWWHTKTNLKFVFYLQMNLNQKTMAYLHIKNKKNRNCSRIKLSIYRILSIYLLILNIDYRAKRIDNIIIYFSIRRTIVFIIYKTYILVDIYFFTPQMLWESNEKTKSWIILFCKYLIFGPTKISNIKVRA